MHKRKKEVRNILIPNQKVEVIWSSSNKKWYMDKGYNYTKRGETFLVNIEDLIKCARNKIQVKCDYCHNIYTTNNMDYLISKQKNQNQKDCCKHCIGKKRYESNKNERAVKMIGRISEVLAENGYTIITTVDEYKNIKQKINFLCNKHGIQSQQGDNILHGYLCPKCKIWNPYNKKTPDEVEAIINSVNGNILLNKEEYISSDVSNLKIRCKCGNVFQTRLGNYLYHEKTKCDRCTRRESKGESIIRRVLEYGNISFERQKRFSDCKDRYTLPFDFYLDKYNLCIEYDGEGHYLESFYEGLSKNPKEALADRQRKDNIKTLYCNDNNIHILRIPYWEIDNIKELILNKLKEIDNNFR